MSLWFYILGSWGTVTCCCRVGMLLLWSWQGGGSRSCFPSGGDRWAVTQGRTFTCSPPKQRHAFACGQERKAFRKVGGGGPGFLLIFQTTPMNHAAHRRAVYYFHSDSGHPLFLHVIDVKTSFWLLRGLGVKCLKGFSPVSVFQGCFMDPLPGLTNHAALLPGPCQVDWPLIFLSAQTRLQVSPARGNCGAWPVPWLYS